MKKVKFIAILFISVFTLSHITKATTLDLYSKSACLMEVSTGKVLYEVNADEKLEPASVTKIMSLLLVFECIEDGLFDYDTTVCASEHASSMGGSQIWLEAGEKMSVDDMLKAVCVASANDCTVALAELVGGSEESFVEKMNDRAKELGMKNTHFSNCTGLPAENHYTTSRDIATMTRELYGHKDVFKYTKIWTDTLRGGEFGISNTNKLIRFYSGATGMKTGYTSSALYCMSATAEKENMALIASVMKCESSDKRFSDARKLLDYGFANYSIFVPEEPELEKMDVKEGVCDKVGIKAKVSSILCEKGDVKKMTSKIYLDEYVTAPVKSNTAVGKITYMIDGKEVASYPIVTVEDVEKITFGDIFRRLIFSSVSIG